MGIKVDGTIKLDIKLVMEATITILLVLTLNNSHQTNQTVSEIPKEVNEIPQEVKKITRDDFVKIFERTNTILEKANQTALTDKQMITIQKQILNEVR